MFTNQIRLPFFLALLILPLSIAALFLWFQIVDVANLEEESRSLLSTARRDLSEKMAHLARINRYKSANPYYLDQEVESLHFCTREIERLRLLVSHPALPSKALLRKRLSRLEGEENRLRFIEEGRKAERGMTEILQRQHHPIQLNSDELMHLLSRLEGNPLGAPQLLITRFQLDCPETGPYIASCNLLKRTFE